jgi:Protein of unknown function (DUF2786)
MNRTAIVEKIKALLAKTTANGCTESEMMDALDKAQAMMDAYDINDAELQAAKEEAAALYKEPPDTTDPHRIKWLLSSGVRTLCGIEIYRTSGEGGLKFIGMPNDTEYARFLLNTLADFVFDELYKHLIGCLAPKRERRVIMGSFVTSCCRRINERLEELVKRSEHARTSNGRELVVIKGAAIKQFMKDNDIRLRSSCCGGGPVDESARAAGRAAGDRASFGRPVGGAGGVAGLIGGR